MLARVAVLIGLLMLLSGCMSSSRQVPANWQLTLNSAPGANQGAPLKVRVLVLRSDANFQSADFYSLQSNASAVLGGDLLDTQQRFLTRQQPKQTISGNPSLDAHYLGVIAEYANINGKTWRVVVPLPAPTETNFYKFWQFSPDALHGHVTATAAGLHLTANDD